MVMDQQTVGQCTFSCVDKLRFCTDIALKLFVSACCEGSSGVLLTVDVVKEQETAATVTEVQVVVVSKVVVVVAAVVEAAEVEK